MTVYPYQSQYFWGTTGLDIGPPIVYFIVCTTYMSNCVTNSHLQYIFAKANISEFSQGLIMGPLLFILYPTDLSNSVTNCRWHAAVAILQPRWKSFFKCEHWSHLYITVFNATQSRHKQAENHPYAIKFVKEILTLFIDEELRFREHI